MGAETLVFTKVNEVRAGRSSCHKAQEVELPACATGLKITDPLLAEPRQRMGLERELVAVVRVSRDCVCSADRRGGGK